MYAWPHNNYITRLRQLFMYMYMYMYVCCFISNMQSKPARQSTRQRVLSST